MAQDRTMKAERRHELKHNELADWLTERMETYKPHASGILLGALVLCVIVLASIYYFGNENQASAKAWTNYFAAFNDREPQKALQSLATEKSGSKAAWWALESIGDMNLSEGAALLYSDRGEAKKRLEQAERAYKQVETSDDPVLKNRARLGLAKVYESLCKPEEARKYYELVAESHENPAIAKAATADAKRMKDSREVAFLEWFANQTPQKPAPLPGFGGAVPNLPGSLPERPDIGMPKGLGLDNLGAGVPPETTPSFPAPASTTPPVTKPGAESDSKAAPPADASKPDDAKSAEPASDTAKLSDSAKSAEEKSGADSSQKKSP
jgi:tetratricopeptide (TPR) repeat protein